jgi:hypothetical protein
MTYITNYLLSIPLEMCHPIYLVLGQLARQQWSLIFILFGCNRMLTRTVEHGADEAASASVRQWLSEHLHSEQRHDVTFTDLPSSVDLLRRPRS